MGAPTLSERLRYWFDNLMARGTLALMGLLGVATVALVVVIGTIAFLVHAYPDDAADGDLIVTSTVSPGVSSKAPSSSKPRTRTSPVWML